MSVNIFFVDHSLSKQYVALRTCFDLVLLECLHLSSAAVGVYNSKLYVLSFLQNITPINIDTCYSKNLRSTNTDIDMWQHVLSLLLCVALMNQW